MAVEVGKSDSGTQRTRRNIMKMGAIAVPATLVTVNSASAGLVCGILGLFGVQCPPIGTGNGNGGNKSNCFLSGTKILTAGGERNIEDLAVGDLLPTMFGGLRPVQWIGRYRYTEKRAVEAVGGERATGSHRPLGSRLQCSARGSLRDRGA